MIPSTNEKAQNSTEAHAVAAAESHKQMQRNKDSNYVQAFFSPIKNNVLQNYKDLH